MNTWFIQRFILPLFFILMGFQFGFVGYSIPEIRFESAVLAGSLLAVLTVIHEVKNHPRDLVETGHIGYAIGLVFGASASAGVIGYTMFMPFVVGHEGVALVVRTIKAHRAPRN